MAADTLRADSALSKCDDETQQQFSDRLYQAWKAARDDAGTADISPKVVDLAETMQRYRINGTSAFDQHPIDAVAGLTRGLHALACYMSAVQDDQKDRVQSEVSLVNSQIVAEVFTLMADVAAQASFWTERAACKDTLWDAAA